MKRGLFFWLERLKVSPGERKAVSALLVLLVLLGGMNLALSPSVPFEDDKYRELEQQFAKRTAMLESKEEKLLAQYYPTPKKQIVEAQLDTVSEDTISQEEADDSKAKSEEIDQKESKKQVNVNKANKKALETLPGIGPTYAERIIKYRNKNGVFEAYEELKNIKGIAEKRLDKLMPFIKLKDSE
jgi:comEA protein